MKIAFLVTNYNDRDGIAIYVHELREKCSSSRVYAEQAAQTKDRGIETQYLRRQSWTLGTYLLEWKFGISFKWLDWLLNSWRERGYRKAVAKLSEFDAVWLQWSIFSEFGEIFYRLSKLRNRPVLIFDYHGITPPKFADTKGKRHIMQKALFAGGQAANVADIVITHSKYTRQELSRFSNVKNSEIVHFFYPAKPQVEKLPSAIMAKIKNKFVLLSFGRIARHKNLELVIRALAKINNLQLRYIIAGNDARPSLRREKERLLKIATELGVMEQIIFTGEVSEDLKWTLLNLADIYVLASFHEGFGWPLIEAMSIPCPVIASNRGAIPEIVADSALLFNPDSETELITQIKKITTDQDVYEHYVEKAKDRGREFTKAKFATRINQIFSLIKLRQAIIRK